MRLNLTVRGSSLFDRAIRPSCHSVERYNVLRNSITAYDFHSPKKVFAVFGVHTYLYSAGWNVWFYQEFNSLKKVAHEMKPQKKVAHEMKPLKKVAHEMKRPKSCTVRFAFSRNR